MSISNSLTLSLVYDRMKVDESTSATFAVTNVAERVDEAKSVL